MARGIRATRFGISHRKGDRETVNARGARFIALPREAPCKRSALRELRSSRRGNVGNMSAAPMPVSAPAKVQYDVGIEIGGMAVRVRTDDPSFVCLLERRYSGFISHPQNAEYQFEVELSAPQGIDPEEDVRVERGTAGIWKLMRGDFRAEWHPDSRSGWIRQTANPYSIDAVLRIVHSLVLARQGGFLVHAASAVRNGRAFLFSGRSGAGKTTISRLAPPDATLLTDEISYVRKAEGSAAGIEGYVAFGTPFTGELAKLGENVKAPIETLYLLAQGPENRVEPISAAEASRALLGNILFFAKDPELTEMLFLSAFEFIERVPVKRLTFRPDATVWELVR